MFFYPKATFGSIITLSVCLFVLYVNAVYAGTSARNWHDRIVHTLPSSPGCFVAKYPETTFKGVACSPPPKRSYYLRPVKDNGVAKTALAPKAGTVIDYALATPSSMLIESATGRFSEVDHVTEKAPYTLQINSKQFAGSTSACNGISGCTIWQQFIYDESSAMALMEYWLFDYGTSCPVGWNNFGTACWKNSPTVSVPSIPAAELGKVSISAFANKNGYDIAMLSYDDVIYVVSQPATVLGLYTIWKEASFNVYGAPGTNMVAEFNRGAFLGVRLEADYGSTPACVAGVFTGESNNFVKDDCVAEGGSIRFDEYVPSFDFTYPVTGQTVKLAAAGLVYATGVAAPGAGVEVVSVFDDPSQPFCRTRANSGGQWVCSLKVDKTASYLLEASENGDHGGAVSDYFCVEVAGQGRCNIRRNNP